jgi:hypothetical protein
LGKHLFFISTAWALRALLGVGGLMLAYFAWPVAKGALEAQQADAVLYDLRTRRPLKLAEVTSALQALDRAVEADATAGLRLRRAELLEGAALSPDLPMSGAQRIDWLRRAEADLEFGLAEAPARGVAWAQLAAARQALDGPSARAVAALMMSIDTSPRLAPLWQVRLQLILANWRFLTPQERERLTSYVLTSWRLSPDRRWFAEAIRSPTDELFLRYLLREDQNAEEELTRLIAGLKKK